MNEYPPDFEARYLSGDELWGDDFELTDIEEWFADEREGYADLGVGHSLQPDYGYGRLNRFLGFKHLPDGRFHRVLGYGSALGFELLPIIDRTSQVTIVEPSKRLRSDKLGTISPEYVFPSPTGDLPFPDGQFDLFTCLGVLHHLPNVSHVLNELARVTRPGGWGLIREPVISMGDWRQVRPGITIRERGIPHPMLDALVEESGLELVRATWCAFPTTGRLGAWGLGFDSGIGVALDRTLSFLTSFNYRYHAHTKRQKLRPTSRFLVVQKSHVHTG